MFPRGWRIGTSRKRARSAERPGGAARHKCPYRPRLEALEDRLAPASHFWQGPAAGGLWSNAANWNGGVPTSNEPGGTLLFFNNSIDSTDDIANLVIDAIQYTGGLTINIPGSNLLDVAPATSNGQVSGAGDLTKNGTGTLELGGALPNSYTGTTFVNAGTLRLNKTSALAIPGPLVIGPANGATQAQVVVISGFSNQLDPNQPVTINPGSQFFSNPFVGQTIGPLTLNGNGAALNTGNVSQSLATTLNADVTVTGTGTALITGLGPLDLGIISAGLRTFTVAAGATLNLNPGSVTGTGALTKAGAGTLVLSTTAPYTGPTTVNAGTLLLDSTLTNSAVTVNSGGTFGGTGSVGGVFTTVNSGGTIAPGDNGPGTLQAMDVVLAAGSTLSADVNGPAAGTQYDVLSSSRVADLTGGPTLNLVFGPGFNAATPVGSTFSLVTAPILTGTFANLPDNTTFTQVVNGQTLTFRINYTTAVVVTYLNAAPTLGPLTVSPNPVPEGSAATLSGSFTDPDALDTHTVVVNWGDSNSPSVSTFALPAFAALQVNQTFTSSTDNAILTITSLTPATNTVGFSLSHVYLNNLPNNAPFTVSVTVTDSSGGSNTATTPANVVNVPPSVTGLAANLVQIFESQTTTLSGTFTDPGPLDTHTVTINWDDPNATGLSTFALGPFGTLAVNQTFTSSTDSATLTITALTPATGAVGFRVGHTYLDNRPGNAPYTIVAVVTDNDGGSSGSVTTPETVVNVPPTTRIGGLPVGNTSPVGTAISVSLTASDPSPIDTAAGFTFAWTVTRNGAVFSSSSGAGINFTPDAPGSYIITLTVTDKDGGQGTNTMTLAVTNIPPTLTAFTAAPATSNEGEPDPTRQIAVRGTFTDPGTAETFAVTIAWGDGRQDTLNVAAGPDPHAFGPVSHLYTDNRPGNAPYTITVTVADNFGGSATATTSAVVLNVPPTAAFRNNGPVTEGSPAVVAFINPTDPSPQDQAAGFAYSYDFNNDGTFEIVNSPSQSAVVPANLVAVPALTVRGRIQDKDGGFSDFTTTISVTSIPLSQSPLENFVRALYRQVLHRLPDAQGFNDWVARLQSGQLTREEVAAHFLTSAERYNIVVEQFYQTLLGRASDPGRAFWLNGLISGSLSQTDVAIGMVTSDEFTRKFPTSAAYAQALYQRLLGRNPSATELAFQANSLDTGLTTRPLMAFGFLAAPETYVDAIFAFYTCILRRQPTAAEEQGWLGVLQAGHTTSIAAQATFFGSGEYFALVQQVISSQLLPC
jgi:autotransporter-associated beta strand protein